jgi:hypothetical protein
MKCFPDFISSREVISADGHDAGVSQYIESVLYECLNSKSCITSYVKEIINYNYAKGVYFLAGDGIFLLSTISISVVSIATGYELDDRGVGV